VPAWRADLHVHTVLSACAETEMIPPLLIARCREQGIMLLGAADHNSAGNAEAVVEAAAGSGVVVKPGLEVESRESVHVLCLFDEVAQALDLQRVVYEHLPALPSTAAARSFGQQSLVDGEGAFLRHEEHALFSSTGLSLAELVAQARARGALVLAAHADRRAHGLLGVLGFVPDDLPLDGLECGPGGLLPGRIASSDAHRLAEIGSRYTVFEAGGTGVEELRCSLAEGRFRTGLAL